MAGVLQARLASLHLVPSCTQPQSCWSGRGPLPLPSNPSLASTSQCCWDSWQPAPFLHLLSSSQATPLGGEERGAGASSCAPVFGCSVGLSERGAASRSYTGRDARRRGDVRCAAGKRATKKKKGGAGGAGAGPRESPAILLRRSSELYESLMRPELLEEGLVREYVVCARLRLGEDPLPEAVRNMDLLQDWLPVAELAFLSAQEDNVADILPLMKREVCECVLRAVPQAKNVPRTMLEYAYEKRASFVKHVLENVDATTREEAPSGEDPFAVLGLSRGASAQQVRTAYRAMAAIYHPDRNPASDAAAKYMQVTKAYEQLKAGGGTASAGFSAYASIGGRERDDLHGPIDISAAAKQVGEGREIAVRQLDEEIVAKFTARAHSVAMKRTAMVERTRRAQAVPA